MDELESDRAHGARIYDYILGGNDNFAVDRQAGEATLRAWPAMRVSMRANRAFMHRVGRFLAAERGVRQFLDIGAGIPTRPNLHEVVQEVAPEARIVYVDNDPIVLAHAQALLTGTPQGRTAYISADVREPDGILGARELHDTLDLDRPVGLLIIAMLQFIEDDEEALRVTRRVLDALPSGSYLAVTIATADFAPEPLGKVREQYNAHGETLRLRTKEQAARFFEGLELEEPGVVQTHRWRPDPADAGTIADADIAMYGAVGRKP
ncbi:SAM-dependent methyltransferase [Pseudonocardia acaciae]|uniref:SAM-dependent methyltransferase n=1 Tax=Pseudonocardia acaciae TaxID=551276 RepID=UPI00048CFDCD|nr:SAM-dependent methyltransferase [Pseudonocardia acaciae]